MSTVSTDPIADMLTRVRNAIAVRKHEISLPYSKVKYSIAQLLKDTRFIDNVRVEGESITKSLTITINNQDANARINEIVRLSKPGRRHYVGASEIPTVMRGRGLVIVSTSKGMMTGADAKKQGIGGELICKVY